MVDSGKTPLPNSDSESDSSPGAERLSENADLLRTTAIAQEAVTAAYDPLDESSGHGSEWSVTAGMHLGKYAIEERIGRGGMGVVWKGFDPDLHRAIAIKVLGPHLAHSATARRRFQREARAAAAINHPNVLTIHSVEEHAGLLFLVMEYIAGQSLKEYLAVQKKIEPMETIRIGCQIAQGLAAAHAQGVIHRDIKPANVMLHHGATCARLSDFGLARVTFDNHDLSSHDQCVGTPAYMSPEMLRGEPIDARSDLFGLGCVFYQMLIGYSPFQGRAQGEITYKILDSKPADLHELDPSIPPVLAEMVGRLLEKDPDRRYQSAAEVADLLSRLQQQLNQAPSKDYEKLLASPPRSKRPRSMSQRTLTMLALVAACGTGAFAITRYRSDQTSAATLGSVAATTIPAGDPAPIIKKRKAISVGPDGDFRTIAQAVLHADTDAIITVVGPGPFAEDVQIRGTELNGLQLIASPRAVWKNSAENHPCAVTIADVSGVRLEGFDFQVDSEPGRAVQVIGHAGDAEIIDCGFRHRLDRHQFSLVLVGTQPSDDDATVAIRDCRFFVGDIAPAGLALGTPGSETRVECSGCEFESRGTHIYSTDACHRLKLSHNVFLGGNNAINLSLKSWSPDHRIEILNNTFVECRYWLGLMDSFRSESLPLNKTDSRVCNNLILGGERVQGGSDQWQVAIGSWTFAANWWERGPDTRTPTEQDRQIATFHDSLDMRGSLDIKGQEPSADQPYLVPKVGSKLLNAGVGGDLPNYIGARTPSATSK